MEDYYNAEAYDNPKNAALSVAVMFGFMVIILYGMKKSGFRAMVAVGNG